jgi:indole-3-acetate monooxygenase
MEIRTLASEAEALQELHSRQLEIIYNNNWFRMFVPKNLGGLGYTLPEVLRTEEALAWADGSAAWVVTLCSGAGWFAGFLDSEIASILFADEKVCLAGSGAASGTAEIHTDGYTINGEWKYASGALHATAFTANCVITQKGIPMMDEGGQPLTKSFIFFRDEVQLSKSWRTMGMVATGSHGFRVEKLHVDLNRMFQINDISIALDNAIYRYPFLQLAEATLAVNFSGMAQQFIDLCKPACDPTDVLQQAIVSLTEYRQDFYRAVETSWSFCSHGQEIPDVVLRQVSNRSYRLYLTSLNLVSTLYPFLGLRGADPAAESNRVFRNIFTASQHTLFSIR